MLSVISTILSFASNVLKIVFKVLSYPIILTVKFIRSISKDDNVTTLFKFLMLGLVYLVYSIPIMFIMFNFNFSDLLRLGGTVGTIYGNDLVEYDGPLEFPNYGGGSTGSGSFGGDTYIIDLDNLPDSVTLPSNYYQNGTVRQRAELLLLIQEICSRPEIDLRPEELLGIFYTEMNGRFYTKESIIFETEPENPDQYGSVGPVQHIKSSFESSDMYEIKGRTYISKMENPNLSDDKRVLTKEESSGLTTPDGQPRPNASYYPDAFYSAAVRISNYKKGIYNNKTDTATEDIFNWLETAGLDPLLDNTIRYQQATSRYNSYNKACCLTWVPQMYIDIFNQHGEIGKWSYLATSNVQLLEALSGKKTNNIPYNEGAGLVGSTSISRTPPVEPPEIYKSYTDYWHSLKHRVHSPHNYLFWSLNGGTWMYEGLRALGDAVGEKVPNHGGSNNGGGPADFIGDWVVPLDGDSFVCTSKFHEDRGTKTHRGIDIDTGTGDNLYAVQEGIVMLAGWDSKTEGGKYPARGGGKMVFVQLPGNYQARYMHLDEILCKVGDRVSMGDIVGLSGNTGGSTGDHLHLELWKTDDKGNTIKEVDPTFLFDNKISKFLD